MSETNTPTDNREDFLKSFGENIKAKRLEKGISAADLARLVYMERSHIARLESGNTNPTATTIKLICDALGLTFEEFFKDFK